MQQESRSSSDVFSQRKKDHIEISLKEDSQFYNDQFSKLELQHNPLPEIDLADVSLATSVFGNPLRSPLFVSSMTLGHTGAQSVNNIMMELCEQRGWMMGLGSQRRQLFDPDAFKECEELRARFPKAMLFGNIGISQIIDCPVESLQGLVDSLKAQFLVVHTNPLQEAIQPEGTPQFRGGLEALDNLCSKLNVPVVLKETGCGFSKGAFRNLKKLSLGAIDVSGAGGTHWGRVETLRMTREEPNYSIGQTFASWGLSTVESLENGIQENMNCDLWASGGVRSGLDAAKLLVMGAKMVGLAQPILKEALVGSKALESKMIQLENELKIAMFCLGIDSIEKLVGKRELLQWK